jgi:hypothetical protein
MPLLNEKHLKLIKSFFHILLAPVLSIFFERSITQINDFERSRWSHNGRDSHITVDKGHTIVENDRKRSKMFKNNFKI